MKTKAGLDPKLLEAAMEVGQHRSKKAALTAALTEYVKARRRLKIFDLMGQIDYYEDYDHKRLRRMDGLA